MTVKFWGRAEGSRVMRLINAETNDLIDIYGEDDRELWDSAIYAALKPLGYRFNASWVHHAPPAPADSSTPKEGQ